MSFFKRDKQADRSPAPFVVGMNRSGTTLLRMMLDAHPELAIPPETHFVPDVIKACRRGDAMPEAALAAMKSHREWDDFGFSDEEMLERLRSRQRLDAGEALRAFYEAYAERERKPRWGEKTPRYVERRMATHAMTTKPPDADRVSRWKRQMSAADREAFEGVAGATLADLGYETATSAGTLGTSR